MKKMLVVLVLLLALIGIGVSKQDVKSWTMNFDFGNLSPRFQYLYDEDDNLIEFEFEITEQYDHPREVQTFNLELQQITYDGEFIKTLETFEATPEIYDSWIREGSTVYTALEVSASTESLYIGDINFLYGGNEELVVLDLQVNASSLLSTDYYFTDDGNYLIIDPYKSTVGDTIEVFYLYEYSDDYRVVINYDWSRLHFPTGDVAFYRLKLDEFYLYSGAVMLEPQKDIDETYLGGDYGLEVGTFLIRDDGEADFSEQSDFTYYLYNDDYYILHYRFDPAVIGLGNDKTIQIIDINSNTLIRSFSTDDFLYVQSGSTDDMLNAFMIIPLNNELGEGLVTNVNPILNSIFNVFLYDYIEGSYFFGMVDQDLSNAYMASASVVVNIVEEENPFELDLLKSEIAIDDLQRVIFYKNSELISSSYTTTLAKDYDVAESYVTQINASDYTYSISYYLDEAIVEDTCINVGWTLEPVFVPYSLTTSDYSITLLEGYCTIAEIDIAGHINNSLVYYALDSEQGGIIFSVFVFLFVNFILIWITKEMFIYAIVNLIITLLLSFMGIIPMWFIIAIFLIGFLGLKFSMRGGRSYE